MGPLSIGIAITLFNFSGITFCRARPSFMRNYDNSFPLTYSLRRHWKCIRLSNNSGDDVPILSLLSAVDSWHETYARAWIIRPGLFTCRPHLAQLKFQAWPGPSIFQLRPFCWLYISWISTAIFQNQRVPDLINSILVSYETGQTATCSFKMCLLCELEYLKSIWTGLARWFFSPTHLTSSIFRPGTACRPSSTCMSGQRAL